MAVSLEADHGVSHSERRGWQALWLIAASLLTLFVLGVDAMAQDSPQPTPTPHWITAPSLPVRGPIISHTPIPPGAMVPTPGMKPPPEHPVQITIDNYVFSMRPGPCASRVRAAIDADDDLFTGDRACDSLIRQARTIQRQKDAEDPAYARAMHATPVPTPDLSGDDETH
jgi:hypothetical protein